MTTDLINLALNTGCAGMLFYIILQILKKPPLGGA